jgi:tetratricopeptide (TPR) repeat protein
MPERDQYQWLPNARRLAGIFICAFMLVLTGCATPQTTALHTQTANELPRRIELSAVPYFAQEAHQCGPATLAMVFGANGLVVTPQQLEPQIYLPAKAGSLQIEMLAATRRNGFLAYPLAPQLRDLLAEIAAGHPVIVLQNLAFNWYPVWHYAVAIGYDLERAEIILRSGPERRQQLPLTTFERTWSRSNYWTMLALTPGELPQSGDAERYLDAAVALEQTRQLSAAGTAYNAALQRWPDNLTAQMGIGNIAYARGDFANAEIAFRTATQHHPDSAAAFNNLADALARQKKYREALAAARTAVTLGGANSEVFAQTLREIETQLNAR